MGFKRVTLIGFDAFTLAKYSHGRWYEKDILEECRGTDSKFISAIKYYISLGIKFEVIGIEAHSALDDIKYLEYINVVNECPVNSTHIQLLTPEALLALKKCYQNI
jgi:hypothetical protein